jgi:hypothetical protein
MVQISVPNKDTGSLSMEHWVACEKCGSNRTYAGGPGEWRQTIVCESCFHIRRGVPLNTIYDIMVADARYEGIRDRKAAKMADDAAQEMYIKTLEKYATKV